MAEARFDQANFTQGEIDPRTQARVDWESYYKAAKRIRNGIVIPQGGVRNRWGTTFVDNVASIGANTNPLFCELSSLIYDDNSVYLLVWENLSLKIYLENILVATVVTTYNAEFIPALRFTQVENRVIITDSTSSFQPRQLIRSTLAANAITGFSAPNSTLTVTNNLVVGQVVPVTFTTTNTLPTTVPQIYPNVTYFINAETLTTTKIYSSSEDAFNKTNFYSVSSAGIGTNNMFVQNSWAISNIPFKFVPAFDFNGNYFGATVTFTPSTVSGTVTITCANATPFTAAHVGGLYIGNGGILRITTFTDTAHVIGYTVQSFADTNAIRGDLSFLGEPAWSTTRGWPKYSTFFQNRLCFGGTLSLSNGLWLSVINDVYNFDDSETLDDNAISYYPSSSSQAFIKALTSSKSLIIHTSTGTYSTPVLQETPITPKTFTIPKQNEYGITNIQPVFIDNQFYFLDKSGNNVIVMTWDIGQAGYVTGNKSVASSSLIVHPIDIASFAQPDFTDGFYVLFVNADGTLCVHQTLLEQNISAWTLTDTSQQLWVGPNTQSVEFDNKYIRVVSALTRCWFTVLRIKYITNVPIFVNAINPSPFNYIVVINHGIVPGAVALVTFTFAGPDGLITSPQVLPNTYYYVLAIDVNNLAIFATQSDAINNTNKFLVLAEGTLNTTACVIWSPQNRLFIEELDFTVNTDSTYKYKFTVPTNTLTGLENFNGQVVTIVGDGFVLQNELVDNGQITLEKFVSNALVGMPFSFNLVPLPITIPGAPGMLYKPKHIRNIYVNYYQTVGATIQGFNVPTQTMQEIILDQIPIPQNGVFEYTPMEGWNNFDTEITIAQDLPLPITILALSYILEV